MSKEIREAIEMVRNSNNKYCQDRVNNILDLVSPVLDEAMGSEKLDESVIVGVYYRRGNDISAHGYACGFAKANVSYIDALAFKKYVDDAADSTMGVLEGEEDE